MADQSTVLPTVSPPASSGAVSLKFLAEVVKYCCFDVLIAIALPPFISIPLRLQEAAASTPPQHPGVAGLIGLPDLLISCGILSWAALRNIMDADYLDKPIRDMGQSITVVIGVASLGLAAWAHNITFANFSTANSFLVNSALTVLASSFAAAGAISVARGMK